MTITEIWSRWFGPTRAQLRAEIEVARSRQARAERERDEAHAMRKQARLDAVARMQEMHNRADRAEAQLQRARIKAALAYEPARTGCEKVRVHYRSEAERWLEQVIAGTGAAEGDMHVYACPVCPRSPITMRRYWHIGHPGTEEGRIAKRESRDRVRKAERQAHNSGLTLGQRIDPALIAKLREAQP